MKKQLFFDDQFLFGRDGVNRVLGVPELIAEYSDGICSTDFCIGNALGLSEPVEGYGVEDCIPFSGDSTDHTPRYKGGRSLDDLVGKTLVFEINFESGALYSLFGDYVDLYNTESARYRMLGVMPTRKF